MAKKVVVGMSGGVDSSVCAYLLKQKGYEVIGVTMRLWQEDEETELRSGHVTCCGSDASDDAARVASILEIPFHVMNFMPEFRENVVDYFINSYKCGYTPNPCIACNRYLKWEALLDRAKLLGAEYIATGHYARINQNKNGRFFIQNAISTAKDQTYVLYNLTQDMLAHTLMPVGDYEKEEIRQIAEQIGLPVFDKKDSQDICFIPDGDYGAFLDRQCPQGSLPGEGNYVNVAGEILGRHKGITHYTIGQRKGLGIALGHPVFVTEIRPETNEVVLGENEDCFTDTLFADQVNMVAEEHFDPQKTYIGRIRYSDRGAECQVSMIDDTIMKVSFLQPVRAVTPGQAVVLYDGDMLVGGGIIRR